MSRPSSFAWAIPELDIAVIILLQEEEDFSSEWYNNLLKGDISKPTPELELS